VERYIEKLYEQLAYHKILEKLRELSLKSSQDWNKQEIDKYEKLDRLITEAVLAAEHLVSKRYSTQYKWSPKLIQAVYALRFARLKLKLLKGIPVTDNAL